MWNIKKVISKGDYYYGFVPEHPNATKNGYVLLHRLIIENNLNRLLNTNEIVHHKNHNKKDNRIENLEVMSKEEHCQLHGLEQGKAMVKLKCPMCGKIFSTSKNQSFLVKHNKLNCTCCSPSCRGKLSSQIQFHGLTHILENAISENLLAEYIEYTDEDNSEETIL